MKREARSTVTVRPTKGGGAYINFRGQAADQLLKLAEVQGISTDEALHRALVAATQGLTR